MKQHTAIFSLLVLLAISARSFAGYPDWYGHGGHDESSDDFHDEPCDSCDDSSEEIGWGSHGEAKPESTDGSSSSSTTTGTSPVTEATTLASGKTTTLAPGETPKPSEIKASITATVQVTANATS